MQQECFCNKLSAHFNPTKLQQLGEGTPLSFSNTLLELNPADRTISLHPTQAFYQQLLGRYSFEDAKGGETPTLELDRKAPRWSRTNLDARRSKLYKMTVEETGLAEQAQARHSFCCSQPQLKLCKTHRRR